MPEINLLAVVAAGVAGFFVGGLWYSKAMFCDVWVRESGITPPTDASMERHPARVFGVGIALSVVAAFAFAWLLGSGPGALHGALRGAAAGAAFVATSFGINYGFAGKSLKLWLVDGGYHVAQFTVMGLVLGVWP